MTTECQHQCSSRTCSHTAVTTKNKGRHAASSAAHPNCTVLCPGFGLIYSGTPVAHNNNIDLVLGPISMSLEDQLSDIGRVNLHSSNLSAAMIALLDRISKSFACLVFDVTDDPTILGDFILTDALYTILLAVLAFHERTVAVNPSTVIVLRSWAEFMTAVTSEMPSATFLGKSRAVVVKWPLPWATAYSQDPYRWRDDSTWGLPLSKAGSKKLEQEHEESIGNKKRRGANGRTWANRISTGPSPAFLADAKNWKLRNRLLPGSGTTRSDELALISLTHLHPSLRNVIYPSFETFCFNHNKQHLLTVLSGIVNPVEYAPFSYTKQAAQRLLSSSEVFVHKTNLSCNSEGVMLPTPCQDGSDRYTAADELIAPDSHLTTIFSQRLIPSLVTEELSLFMVNERHGSHKKSVRHPKFITVKIMGERGGNGQDILAQLDRLERTGGRQKPQWLHGGSHIPLADEDKDFKQLLAFARKVDQILVQNRFAMLDVGYRLDLGLVKDKEIWQYYVSEVQPLFGGASLFDAARSCSELIGSVGNSIGRALIEYFECI